MRRYEEARERMLKLITPEGSKADLMCLLRRPARFVQEEKRRVFGSPEVAA